jgi:hypothetical protein
MWKSSKKCTPYQFIIIVYFLLSKEVSRGGKNYVRGNVSPIFVVTFFPSPVPARKLSPGELCQPATEREVYCNAAKHVCHELSELHYIQYVVGPIRKNSTNK